MSKTNLIVALFAFAPFVTYAQPVVSSGGVLSASSYSPSIARGSMFVVFGSNLGLTANASSLPIPTNLGGTIVRITAGGTTREAPIFYTTPGQLAAILPSATAEGSATLTVTAGGQTSAPVSFNVVRSNFGAFTNNQRGTGPAAMFNFNSQTEQPRNGLAQAANPGQVVILWGTGLGPIAGNDAGQPPVGDLDTNIEVLVGGRPARVLYKGRSPEFPAIDQINFEVPQGVEGCYMPVVVRTPGSTQTQGITMSVAPNGRACTEPGLISSTDLERARAQGSLRVGSVLLIRYTFGDSPVSFDLGMASFSRARYDDLVRASQRLAGSAPGGCEAARTDGTQTGTIGGTLGADFFDDYLFFSSDGGLDAGEKINLSGSGQTLSLDRSSPGLYFGALFNQQNPLQGFLQPGSYAIDNGSGGRDVTGFRTNINIPAALRFTNANLTSIPRSRDLNISWTGGAQNERVLVSGVSVTQAGQLGGAFVCVQNGNAGRITVPSSVLSVLPASGGQGVGLLYLYSFSPYSRSEPGGGLDAFYVATLTLSYQLAQFE